MLPKATQFDVHRPFGLCAAGVFALSMWCIVIAGQGEGGKKMNIVVGSPAFSSMQPIPSKYTCDGADISPAINWENIPAAAKSIVLICDDPDAPVGDWVHWVCYDIPPTVTGLPENVAKADTIALGGTQGLTDFHRIGYGGPCPPGGTHRYFFKVYALDTMLHYAAGKTKKEIEKAIKGHILAQGELVGVYSRAR
jgi:Raf kinase inhibitor-like YbhB/YbcL family protein